MLPQPGAPRRCSRRVEAPLRGKGRSWALDRKDFAVNTADLLKDSFERMRDIGHNAVEGLSDEQLAIRLEGKGNSIAWLIWHLARVQDDHLADVGGYEQVWTAQGWVERF